MNSPLFLPIFSVKALTKSLLVTVGLTLAPLTSGQTLTQNVDTGEGFATSGASSVGDEIIYRLQYTFPGITSGFSNVVITDTLAPELEFLALVNSPHIASSNFNSTTREITFTFDSNVPSGATGEVLVRTRFPNGTETGTQVLHNASMTGTGGTLPINATPADVLVTAVDGTTPTTLTNGVLIVKTPASNPVHLGSGQTYNINYGTLGGEPVNTFIIEDLLPSEFILERIRHVAGFQASVSFDLEYQTNGTTTNGVYTPWDTGSGNTFDASTTFTGNVSSLGLNAGEYITALRFTFSSIPAGADYIFANGANIALTGDITTKFLDSNPTDVDGNPVTVGTSFDNTVTLDTNGQYTTLSSTASNTITADETYLRVTKTLADNTPEDGQITTVALNVRSPLRNVGNLENPVIYELLPPEMEYVGGLTIDTAGRIPNGFLPTLPDLEAFPDWDSTGRTLIKLSWNAATNPLVITPNTETYGVVVNFNVQIPFGTPEGDYANIAAFSLDNPHICQNQGNNFFIIDANDFDQDGDRAETLCSNSANFEVFANASGLGLNSQKWVKGQCDTEFSRFPSSGSTTPAGTADYEIRIINPSTKSVDQIDVLDILPHLGDTGVIDSSARLSEWEPVLVGPVSFDSANFPPGINGVTVYYSTSTSPSHDLNTAISPTNLPDPLEWSTTPPVNITTVKSLLLSVDGTLAQTEELALTIPMRAPIDAPTNGEIAWNSFGFSANSVENGTRLLPTEPIKVGITTKPLLPPTYGDFVWFDTNQNGIQESTENGINGVRVELYSPSGASPDPANDTLVGFTVTQTAFGEDGAYLFPDLTPGDFYAVFYPPTGYNVSPVDQGLDDTLDSDGTLTILNTENVYVTAITNLVAGDQDLSWDQGFFTTNNGIFLGDYVWADIDADGFQDPSESGLGGVTVKILDSNDIEIGTTSTSPNGFYLFGGPGNDNLNTLSTQSTVTESFFVTASEDDASQPQTGGNSANGETHLDITARNNDSLRIQGFRFTNLNIPPGATIDSAFLQFTSNSGTTNSINGGNAGNRENPEFTIRIEDSINAVPFTNNASGPANRTAIANPNTSQDLVVPWGQPNDGDTATDIPLWDASVRTDDQKTPDLSTLLQSAIDLTGWNSTTNSIVLLIDGTMGQREALSADTTPGDNSDAPELIVTYTVTSTSQAVLQPNEEYSICIDTTQNALTGFDLTTEDATSGSTDDTTDSDAITVGDDAVITYTPPSDPTFDMTLDFGFTLSGTVAKANSFTLWQATNPLSGANAPLDNPDGDLFSNLLEYALCLKPDTGLKIFPDGSPNNSFCVRPDGSGDLEAVYSRPEGAADLGYELLQTIDGITWREVTTITPTVSASNGVETVTYPALKGLGSEGLLALRATLTAGSEVYTSTTPACGWKEHPVALACETYSNPFTNECLFSGSGSVTPATRIVDLSGSLASGDDLTTTIINPNAPVVYLLEITSGTYQGHRFQIEAASSDTITLMADADLFVDNPCNTSTTIPDFSGDTLVIHTLPSIDDLFPVTEFQAGANSDLADNLLLYDASNQLFADYYLLDDTPDKWVQFGSIADEGGTPICPGQGLFTHAKANTFTLTLSGPARNWDTVVPLAEGYTLVGAAHPLAATPLQRNLLTLNGTTDPRTADQFITWRGDTDPNHLCYDGHFYAFGGSFNQWSAVGDNTLTSLNSALLFPPDRAALYCIRSNSGKPDYLIPTNITLPADTRP